MQAMPGQISPPKNSVPLAGYGNTLMRMNRGVLDPLMATFMHRQNIVRLFKDEERRTNLFKKDKE